MRVRHVVGVKACSACQEKTGRNGFPVCSRGGMAGLFMLHIKKRQACGKCSTEMRVQCSMLGSVARVCVWWGVCVGCGSVCVCVWVGVGVGCVCGGVCVG